MQIVAHVDMDAFFASIEERENPQFVGLGIVVGADPKYGRGRGVVSTANYQARKYGIHSAQPISTAWRLSQDAQRRGQPKTVFLPVNGAYYGQVSDNIMRLISKYVRVIEQTSIDEAYLDLSSVSISDGRLKSRQLDKTEESYEKAIKITKTIKSEIKTKEKLTATVGIGPNKLIAKMASGLNKPDGLTVIKPEEVKNFLDPLPIGDIPGIGPKTEEFFHKKNIFRVLQLKQMTKDQLQNWMGKWGEDIYQKARGIDESEVTEEREIKSISEQETFEKDTASPAFILDRLDKLATRVIERMKDDSVPAFKTVSIVVRFSDFSTKSRAHTLKSSTNSLGVLKNEAIKLLLPFLDRRENPQKKLIRLIGVGIENFFGERDKQLEEKQDDKNKRCLIQESLL